MKRFVSSTASVLAMLATAALLVGDSAGPPVPPVRCTLKTERHFFSATGSCGNGTLEIRTDPEICDYVASVSFSGWPPRLDAFPTGDLAGGHFVFEGHAPTGDLGVPSGIDGGTPVEGTMTGKFTCDTSVTGGTIQLRCVDQYNHTCTDILSPILPD